MNRRTFTLGLAGALAAPRLGLAASQDGSVTIYDSRGPQRFPVPPKRPAALTWSLVQQLLGFGIAPVGVADPEGYRRWVGQPSLPPEVVGLGLRQEPHIEAVAALAPDVILISDDQLAFADRLERIAPVVHFDAFSADHDNGAQAIEIFKTLAALFQREEAAKAALAEQEARLSAKRAALADRFPGDTPPVAIVRFIDAQRVALHGSNAMSTAALEGLGLENATPSPPTQWGISMQPIRALGELDEAAVLYMEPFPQAEEVFARPLWRAMPFVRAERFAAMPPVWTYGGALSIGYLGEAIADSLIRMEGV